MKKALKLVLLVLVFGFVGMASAQHRGGQHGGYNGGQHHGYNGHQYNSHNVQRHNGQNFRNVLIGGVVLAGTAVALNSIFNSQPQVVVVEEVVQQQPCRAVQQQVTDAQGRPLYDRYTGQPLIRLVSFCPAPMVRY